LPKRWRNCLLRTESLMDILSEVLHVVRLSGVVHFRGEFTQPWAFTSSPPEMLAARLKLATESMTPFHVFIAGDCWISSGKLPALRLETGDVIVLPRGDQHVMASDLGIAPVPIKNIYPRPSVNQVAAVKYGGGGKAARFICGFLHSDQRFAPLLDSLPTFICIRLRNGTVSVETVSEEGQRTQPVQPHEAEWWQATLRYFISEASMPGQGNRAVLARLSELLFMEVIRWQLRDAAGARRGWLAGLNDPQVGRALSLLHAEPARPWTVEELAQRAAISRAALAKRFVDLVGESPMQYLAEWRMHLARHLLRESTLGIGEVAGRVGYESEAAFNRAFRRLVGAPPATWRRAESLSDTDKRGQSAVH
jgi:AraC-like DNA-binding protein